MGNGRIFYLVDGLGVNFIPCYGELI